MTGLHSPGAVGQTLSLLCHCPMRGQDTHPRWDSPARPSGSLPSDTPANADARALRSHSHILGDTPRHNQGGEDRAEGDLGSSHIPTPQLQQDHWLLLWTGSVDWSRL